MEFFQNSKKLFPLRFWCQKILPLTYDDSLSYYEAICRISAKCNEIIDAINNIDDSFKDYVNSALTNIISYIDEQDKLLELQFNQKIAEIIKKHDDELLRLYQYVVKINNEIYEWVKFDQDRQDQKMASWLIQLYDEINELIKDINTSIDNPITGQVTSIIQAINDLYNALRYKAFDCITFDSMAQDCLYWDGRLFTALEFDLYGYAKYGYPSCDCYMMNPFTGQKDLVANVVQMIISRDSNSLDCDTFDGTLYITVSYYDDKEMDAYIADFENRPILLQRI